MRTPYALYSADAIDSGASSVVCKSRTRPSAGHNAFNARSRELAVQLPALIKTFFVLGHGREFGVEVSLLLGCEVTLEGSGDKRVCDYGRAAPDERPDPRSPEDRLAR